MDSKASSLPLDPMADDTPATQQQPDNANKKSNTGVAAAATGAAAAGAGAAAYYAYNAMTGSDTADIDAIIVEDDEILEEEPVDEIEVAATGNHEATAQQQATVAGETPVQHTTGGNTAPTQTQVGTETPAQNIETPVEQPVETPTEPVIETPGEEKIEEIEETVEYPADPVINPQIEVSDPDEIAEALIAVEEIDENDFDGTQPFAFTDVETVYDIDGNATVEARYIDEDGQTGVMIDLDGDGVFDILEEDGGAIYQVNSEGFLTVGDAELDAETGYIAYDEDLDSMIDDDPTDDIIDSEDFA